MEKMVRATAVNVGVESSTHWSIKHRSRSPPGREQAGAGCVSLSKAWDRIADWERTNSGLGTPTVKKASHHVSEGRLLYLGISRIHQRYYEKKQEKI